MPIRARRSAHGKIIGYQADYSDAKRGIPRTKRNFPPGRKGKAEAQDWLAQQRETSHDRRLGRRERYLFGQALARYLAEESPRKRSHRDDYSNARALRAPIWDPSGRTWRRLEDAPLDDSPQGVVAALNAWAADQRAIERRSYYGAELYQLRRSTDGTARWYVQPDPAEGARPQPRREVTDRALLARIEAAPGRGPVSTDTLRVRQALARRVLRLAYRRWRWTATNLAELVESAPPGAGREIPHSSERLRALVIHAPPGLDEAILGAAGSGWRRAALLGRDERWKGRSIEGLTWTRVEWPVWQEQPDGTRELLRPGLLWYTADESKSGRSHYTPMSGRIEQLLRLRWLQRCGPLVFHRGDGRPWGDLRKAWARTKRAAGEEPGLRWHDLRHMFAGELAEAGATDGDLMQLGGWSSTAMVQRYTKRRADHLQKVLDRAGR